MLDVRLHSIALGVLQLRLRRHVVRLAWVANGHTLLEAAAFLKQRETQWLMAAGATYEQRLHGAEIGDHKHADAGLPQRRVRPMPPEPTLETGSAHMELPAQQSNAKERRAVVRKGPLLERGACC